MDVNQDDIDKMLQDALSGGGSDPAPAADAPAPAEPDMSGVASQDDIDALFAAAGDDAPADAPAPAPAAAPEPEPAPAEAEAEADVDLDGVANQDDIDALFAAVGGDVPADEPAAEAPAAAPAPEPEPAPEPKAAPEAELDLEGVAGQNDIDALFAAVGGDAPGAAPEPEPEPEAAPEAPAAEEEAAPDQDGTAEGVEQPAAEQQQEAAPEPEADGDEDLDALLSSIATESGAAGEGDASAVAAETTDIDMEALLREVSDAAPPPPPPPPSAATDAAETLILDPEYTETLARDDSPAQAGLDIASPAAAPEPAPAPAPQSAPAPAPAAPTAADVMAAFPGGIPAAPSGPRREFSVLYGAGDVESVANQINALLNSLSEKAHGYMQSWIAADSEAKELRTRALEEERRRSSLESEKAALARQAEELRTRVGELEGGKVATEEAKRTLETSFQAKIRELESRVSMLSAEAETLKDELTRSRNEATGVDIESRRVRFELDRLKNEVESERMERLRIQRALENREKEIQAMQSQASGQASSLFIDELHRLVRRLESELEARSAGAHEALRQLDRIEVSEDMVPVAANLRAALMHALGQDSDADDALKSLGREASGVRGPTAVAPQKAEIVSFETALSTYNLVGAVDIAGVLLREATATPAVLMRKMYQCPALRRPEVADHLADLARLLEGLRTVQEANDRSRGSESGDSEVFYVHMFDFMHNLVRLKLINRMSGDVWRLFLDLRGRFSFVTSDKQWADYRDNTLRDKNLKP